VAVPADLTTGYTAIATAGGAQVGDTKCAKIAVRLVNGSIEYGSGPSALDWTDANRCWAR
jgi:hypothetical protein